MKMKTTLLTLCLAISLAVIAKWTPSLVSANTTVVVCGQVLGFTPATVTAKGSLRIDATTYEIAPGTTIGGQAVLKLGASVCLDLTFNGGNQITPPSKVGGATVNVCGTVSSFTPSTPQTQGAISIGSSSYAIASGTTLDNQMMIAVGANMCLTATLNGAGQITNPSAVTPNSVSPILACGSVSSYQAATNNSTGFISIGGLNFTIGAGVSVGNVSPGSNACLQGVLDVNGQLITPSAIAANTSGASSICGVVTAFQQAFGGLAGSISLGGVTIQLAPGLFLPGQNEITIGANVCISPLILSGGRIGSGSVASVGTGGCQQFAVPMITHGLVNDEDDSFLLPKPLVFTASAKGGIAGVFNADPATFGGYPKIQNNNKLQGIMALSQNSTVRALSCTDSFWDVIFDIATKGNTEGDMVTLFLQSPNSSNNQILAMFTIQNGGVVLNQLHPDITMLMGGGSQLGPGAFIPLLIPSGSIGVSTPRLTIIFIRRPNTPLDGCFQLGIDIKRMGGNGMTTVVPQFVVVKRMGDNAEGPGMQSGQDGTYPTGLVCGVVCNGCFFQPTPTPTPTPSQTPTPTPTPDEDPTPTPSPTPTPTPPPMAFKCDTICFRSASFFQLRLDYLPNGSILIGGANFNNPVSIQRSKDQIRIALQGGAGPTQQLNQQFVATQLSLAFAGGTGSPVVFNSFWSPLKCSGINFQPVTLSNGVTLTPDSLLDTLVSQAQLAIRQNRTADMIPIAQILALLNARC